MKRKAILNKLCRCRELMKDYGYWKYANWEHIVRDYVQECIELIEEDINRTEKKNEE